MKRNKRERSFHPLKNFRASATLKGVGKDAQGIAAAIPFLLAPSIFRLNDFWAWGLASGTTWSVGAMLKNDFIKGGAFALMAYHIMRSFLKVPASKIGIEFWDFTALGDTAMYGLSEAESYRLPDGQVVRAYNPTDLPATSNMPVDAVSDCADCGVHDRYTPKQLPASTMSDRYVQSQRQQLNFKMPGVFAMN